MRKLIQMSCVPPARSDDAFNRKSLPVKGFLALLLLSAALVCAGPVQAQRLFTISGVVLNKSTKKPVDMAVITLPQSELWAVANNRGEFTVKNVPGGESTVGISCLGYITQEVSVVISRDVDNLTFYLDEDNLAIEGVVVTARENQNSLTTSRTIDRTAMDHMQLVDVADISALLPGGVSVNPDLMGASQLGVRQYGGSEKGFGTAIEVDGVRMSNNADFNAMQGLDMRNIASANVASIEVITGVPSVEYGDIATGVVKIHTQKGRTPYMVSTTLNPKLKQFALNKGFDLGGDRGVLNFSIERAQSVKDLPSPYEAYDRNTATLNYSNTFNLGENRHPLRLSVGLTGNIGGRDKKDDPDIYTGNFEKVRDNNFRANTSLNWLLNKSWITSLEFSGSVSYSDKFSKINDQKTSSTAMGAPHGMDEGYSLGQLGKTNVDEHVTIIPSGTYYELALTDDKPVSYSAQLKLNWVHRWGGVNSKLKLGVHYTGEGNNGRGLYYDDPQYAAAGWRPYEYNSRPYVHNIAAYLEEALTIPIKSSSLDLVAGLRNDNTAMRGSLYGTVSSISPRFNAKFTLYDGKGRRNKALRSFSVRAGWGKMVKLPSYYTLYPTPSYIDEIVFGVGETFAYYMYPLLDKSNPNLKWQYTNQTEVGVDFNLYGVQVSLSAYYNKTHNPYIMQNLYTPYTYTFSNVSNNLTNCPIEAENREYSIDRNTGVVTVTDKSGAKDPYEVPNTEYTKLKSNTMAANGSAYERMGLEWVVDFGQIRPIRTDVRIDGAFNYYKRVEQTLMAGSISSNALGADGTPYKYIGWYIGNTSGANGLLSKEVRANLTLTTHLPKIRTILSVRLETSLYRFSRNLSEWYGGGDIQRSYVIESDDIRNLPLIGQDIYAQRNFVITYPAYYSTADAPDTKLPYLAALLDAKENNAELYIDLLELAKKTNNDYQYQPSKISAYCALNISITKEIGKFASISFYANNCFNNMGRVHNSQNDTYSPLYHSSYLQNFYYGASLRLKF